MKNSSKALLQSVVALILCVSMLVGTTMAWFTDSVTSAVNKIQSGNLDVELVDAAGNSLEGKSLTFLDVNGNANILWEPGCTFKTQGFRVSNKGDLALKYTMYINGLLGDSKLLEVIDFRIEDAEGREVAIDDFVGHLSGNKSSDLYYLVGHMAESAGNEYQGLTLAGVGITVYATQAAAENDSFDNTYDQGATFPTLKLPGSITAGVKSENGLVSEALTMADAADTLNAQIPTGVKLDNGVTELTLSVTEMTASGANIQLQDNEILRSLDVHIAGVAADNTKPMQITIRKAMMVGLNIGNYTLYHVENGTANAMTSVSTRSELDAHNEFYYDPATGDVTLSLATFSEVAVVAEPAKWEGNRDYSWYTNAVAPVDGEAVTGYIIANADQLAAFGAIVGGMDGQTQDSFAGKTVKLIADINLGDKESENNPDIIFYPIGYWNNEGTYERKPLEERTTAVESGFYTFEGTFDGNGHTISNFYQNTWEMKGDHNWYDPIKEQYYRDGMGLFGKVYGGTVKNLTVSNFSSDGEIATTGVIAAYADGATFENIAITNCNPRVYNIGNGGIVGCVGWYAKEADLKTTFTNITVDNSNKISALWGSWDVACGGIVGQYYPTSGQTSAGTPKNGGIEFANCHVSAIMDVYNDVCANYQYYAYRYTGMLIGSVRENETIDGHVYPKMDGITASGCTVHFGDWNDYYYCELVANSLASYTHDHQMSRLTQVASVDVANKTVTDLKGNTTAIPTSGRVNYVVVKAKDANGMWIHGDGHDYAECYHFVNGVQHFHDVADTDNPNPTETVNGVEGVLKEDKQLIYREFNQLFTGYGWGVTSKGVDDVDGVTILDKAMDGSSVEKFETKFTGDFLYRVGNKNAVSLGTLFQVKDELPDFLKNIVASSVWVTIEPLNKTMSVDGVYTKSTTNSWMDAKIKFNGTGIVKVTIQDYIFCEPTVLYLEIVDATNHTSATIGSLGSGNVALLTDTKLNSNGSLALQNASLYGNGFTLDVSAGKTTGESITANYLLYMNNATIDNVQIIGAVYTNFDVISSNPWNNPIILSIGNSTIANSYIANCASPVRVRSGNLQIINTTLKGGFFANLDIRGGHVVLDNVTTINQANLNDKATDGTEIVGMGIVVYYEGPTSETKITIKNNLTQYNYLENTQTANSYANMLINQIFGSNQYGEFIYTDANGKQWANTGIVSLSEDFGTNINSDEQANRTDYKGMQLNYNHIHFGNVKGYLYTTNPKVLCDSYTYSATAQYEIVPKVSFDHTVNEVVKTDNSETSCTFDPLTNAESITFADGDSFDWNVNILKCANKNITYTVWVDGVQYTDKITFSESGKHTVVFKYADAINYRQNGNQIVQYTVEYETSMTVVVTKKEAAAKSAEITFPLLESYGTTKVTVDGKTYIMPNLTNDNVPKYGEDLTFDASTRNYGSLKADGRANVDIYYPIIKTAISGNYMVYPVFGNKNGTLVQIQDYADGGAGAALTPYNASTQSLPTGLSVSRGYTVQWSTDKDVVGSGSMSYGGWTSGLLCMKYQSSSDDIACKVMSNYLSYYPNINLRSNDRNEQVQVVEYKYVDAKGDTYYYCVGYHIEERNSGYAFGETVPEDTGSCITGDTLITLADGTQVRIDEVTYSDSLLVWNFFKGEYVVVPAALIVNHGYDNQTIIKLTFEDGTEVKAINAHSFFDADTNSWELINANNAHQYLGHEFVQADGDGYTTVKLTGVDVYQEYTESYSLVSAGHYNFITENMFSLTNSVHNMLAGLVVGEDMTYDQETLESDIAEYGLYTYADFADYITYEQYVAFNGDYLKISVGKGMITLKEILALIETYLNN